MISNRVLSRVIGSPLGDRGARGQENPFVQYRYLTKYFDSNGRGSERTRSLLALNDALDYEEPINYDDGLGKNLGRLGKPLRAIHATAKFKAFPNPALDYVNIDYEIYETFEHSEIQFVDVLGRTVHTYSIKTNKDQVLIKLPAGIHGQFECVLVVDGVTFSSTSLSISAP